MTPISALSTTATITGFVVCGIIVLAAIMIPQALRFRKRMGDYQESDSNNEIEDDTVTQKEEQP